MSDNKESSLRNATTKLMIAEMMGRNFTKLPQNDQRLFVHAPFYLGITSGLAGLVANILYRRALNITQAIIASSLPMAFFPFMNAAAVYTAAVTGPLSNQDLNCPSCALLRGGMVGVFMGFVHPIILALPLNYCLSTRYETALMPERGHIVRHWIDVSRPIVIKMRAVALLQALFGIYLASRNFQTYHKLEEITFRQREELED